MLLRDEEGEAMLCSETRSPVAAQEEGDGTKWWVLSRSEADAARGGCVWIL
jgi:hypothetical protein